MVRHYVCLRSSDADPEELEDKRPKGGASHTADTNRVANR